MDNQVAYSQFLTKTTIPALSVIHFSSALAALGPFQKEFETHIRNTGGLTKEDIDKLSESEQREICDYILLKATDFAKRYYDYLVASGEDNFKKVYDDIVRIYVDSVGMQTQGGAVKNGIFAFDFFNQFLFYFSYHLYKEKNNSNFKRKNNIFYDAIDKIKKHGDKILKGDEDDQIHIDTMKGIHHAYIAYEKQITPFLEETGFDFQSRVASEYKRENDDISKEILGAIRKSIPEGGVVIRNTTLYRNSKNLLAMQFTDIQDIKLGQYFLSSVNYFKGKTGNDLLSDEKIQGSIKPTATAQFGKDEYFNLPTFSGQPPTIFIDRNLEIRMSGVGSDILKRINPLGYEVIRRDVLFYFAGLVCAQEDVARIFDKYFTRKNGKKNSNGGIRGEFSHKSGKTQTFSGATSRILSRELGKIVTQSGDNEEKRQEEYKRKRVAFTRLLPVIRKGEEEYIAYKPSPDAKIKAEHHNIQLRKGVYIVGEGTIYPEELTTFLADKGLASIEELLKLLDSEGKRGVIRYETCVVLKPTNVVDVTIGNVENIVSSER